MMENIIYLWFGVLIGITINLAINIKHSHGVLKIDKSDPDKDSYLFEIDNLDSIEKTNWIRLKVVKNERVNRR